MESTQLLDSLVTISHKEQKMHKLLAIYLSSLFLCTSISACNSEAPKTFPQIGTVCVDEGLCVVYDDGDSFHGAFRQGDKELQFKIHHNGWSPTHLYAGSGSGYSACLMTEEQQEFISHGMRCTEIQGIPPQHCQEDYWDIAKKFLVHLESTRPFNNRENEWRVLISMMHNFGEK
jgi:hypothetical protein